MQILCAESPVLKEDKPPTGTSDANVSGRPGYTGHRRHKSKMSVDKEKLLNEFPRTDTSKSGKSKPGRESKVDYKALSEGKQLDQSISKSWKRKNKSSSFEVSVELRNLYIHFLFSLIKLFLYVLHLAYWSISCFCMSSLCVSR